MCNNVEFRASLECGIVAMRCWGCGGLALIGCDVWTNAARRNLDFGVAFSEWKTEIW